MVTRRGFFLELESREFRGCNFLSANLNCVVLVNQSMRAFQRSYSVSRNTMATVGKYVKVNYVCRNSEEIFGNFFSSTRVRFGAQLRRANAFSNTVMVEKYFIYGIHDLTLRQIMMLANITVKLSRMR